MECGVRRCPEPDHFGRRERRGDAAHGDGAHCEGSRGGRGVPPSSQSQQLATGNCTGYRVMRHAEREKSLSRDDVAAGSVHTDDVCRRADASRACEADLWSDQRDRLRWRRGGRALIQEEPLCRVRKGRFRGVLPELERRRRVERRPRAVLICVDCGSDAVLIRVGCGSDAVRHAEVFGGGRRSNSGKTGASRAKSAVWARFS